MTEMKFGITVDGPIKTITRFRTKNTLKNFDYSSFKSIADEYTAIRKDSAETGQYGNWDGSDCYIKFGDTVQLHKIRSLKGDIFVSETLSIKSFDEDGIHATLSVAIFYSFFGSSFDCYRNKESHDITIDIDEIDAIVEAMADLSNDDFYKKYEHIFDKGPNEEQIKDHKKREAQYKIDYKDIIEAEEEKKRINKELQDKYRVQLDSMGYSAKNIWIYGPMKDVEYSPEFPKAMINVEMNDGENLLFLLVNDELVLAKGNEGDELPF